MTLEPGLADDTVRWRMGHSNRWNWASTLAACEEARDSIAIEQYILAPQGIGRTLLELLARRAREGVAVRVMLDSFGSASAFGSQPARALQKAGGALRSFHGLSALMRHPIGALPRLHRKTVICDRAAMLVGGSCFEQRMADWRDTMAWIEGAPAAAAAAAFDRIWQAPRATRHARVPPPPAPETEPVWQHVVSGEDGGTVAYPDLLLDRIAAAERSVVLAAPYLLYDPWLWRTLRGALARGVALTLIVPARGDIGWVNVLTRQSGRMLARAGARVLAYQPAMLHAKLALIDDAWAAVGSLNLDPLSLRVNFEAGIASRHPAFCATLGERLAEDAAQAASF